MSNFFYKTFMPGKVKEILAAYYRFKSLSYKKDGLFTAHNPAFINDSNFQSAYNEGKKTGSWGDSDIEWRVHVVLWFANYASKLVGDFVECGVNKGGLSRAIVEKVDLSITGKRFFLFDTFEGFDESLLNDSEKKTLTHIKYESAYEHVVNIFKEYKYVRIVKGSVPATLDSVEIKQVAFLHIDMNCVYPEKEALNYFWPKIVKGGVIVLDDFAYEGFGEQNYAHQQWAKEIGIEILTLPTGQGVIIK